MDTPVLYSFRRCPYCMRAHMALKNSGIKVELREVKLEDIPEEALAISPQSTVPVLAFPDGSAMDESWDIVKWALSKNDTDNWLGKDNGFLLDADILIETNDYSFKTDLDHYKYADRFPEHSEQYYREQCEAFIKELEDILTENTCLLSDQLSLADIGVFPFIRQFSLVDKEWFDQAPYPNVQRWLNKIINSDLFQDIFQKHELWKAGNAALYL